MCLGHNCSVKEKVEFERCFKSRRCLNEDVLEEVEKFYLGDMFSSHGGVSEAVSARIGSAWKKFRELAGVLVGKQGFSSVKYNSFVWDRFFCTVVKLGNFPVNIYLFKGNNKNTRKKCEICSKLVTKTQDHRHWHVQVYAKIANCEGRDNGIKNHFIVTVKLSNWTDLSLSNVQMVSGKDLTVAKIEIFGIFA